MLHWVVSYYKNIFFISNVCCSYYHLVEYITYMFLFSSMLIDPVICSLNFSAFITTSLHQGIFDWYFHESTPYIDSILLMWWVMLKFSSFLIYPVNALFVSFSWQSCGCFQNSGEPLYCDYIHIDLLDNSSRHKYRQQQIRNPTNISLKLSISDRRE